jgi:dienelactone hydrolase
MLTRSRLFDLLGVMPERCELDPKIEESVELEGVVRQRVTYAVEPGDRVAAYCFVPRGASGKNPAVFAHHQHNGEYHLGKSEPAGIAGNLEQAYALELARRGYVVLAPDAICFEERGACRGSLDKPADWFPGADFERFEFTRRILWGSCLQTKMLWDSQRGVDYLVSRADVDAERIGAIGHSLGGQQTLFLAAADERIRAAVSSCGFSSIASILEARINHNYGLYVPGLMHYGEVGALLALVAPRAFLALNGEDDSIFPIQGLWESVALAAPAFETRGVRERLEARAFPGGHGFKDAMREQAYAWLDRWLGVSR